MYADKKSKKKKKKLSLTTKLIIIVSFLFITLLGSFIGTYYISMDKNISKYEKDLTEAITIINNANSSTKELITDKQSVDSAAVVNKLSKIISELDTASQKINSLVPSEKYKNQQKYILDGLEQNKQMYKQMQSILKNLQSQDLATSLNQFNNYQNQCETQYSLFNMDTMSISLPDDTIKFIERFKTYMNTYVEINRDIDIASTQTQQYLACTDDFINKFKPLNTDFSVELKKARSSSITFNDVLNTIDTYSIKCSDIKKNILNISVPKNCTTLQNNILSILEDYNLFIEKLINNVNNEKSNKESSGKNLDKNSLNRTYSDSTNEYLALNDKFDNFLNSYNNFKTNNLK